MKFQVGANGDASSQITVDLSKAMSPTRRDHDLGVEVHPRHGDVARRALSRPRSTRVATSRRSHRHADGTHGRFTSVDQYAALNKDANFSANFTRVATDATATTGSPSRLATAASSRPRVGGRDDTVGSGLVRLGAGPGAIKKIDEQIKVVSEARSSLGAVQNRFDHAINVTNVAKENLTAAGSRITDVDMAQEMVKYTRDNILSQAGTSMLAQANQSTQGVLSLLR